MKFLLFLVIALPLIAGEFKVHNTDDVDRAQEKCFVERHPPMELFQQFKKLEFPQHESTACYIQCLLEQLDMFDAEKGFLMENIMEQMIAHHPENEERTKRGANKCMDHPKPEAGSDTCAFAAQTFNCFMTENKDIVLMSFVTEEKDK